MSLRSREIRLAARPRGMPQPSDFELAEVELPDPVDGRDPRPQRVRLGRPVHAGPDERRALLRGAVRGRRAADRRRGRPGRRLSRRGAPRGRHGSCTTSAGAKRQSCAGERARVFDPAGAPLSTSLGVLGMPGLTAYVGLDDIGQVKDGDTVFVSGAAGAVGSLAGQIARRRGARVIGSAGVAAKISLARRARLRRGVRLPRDTAADSTACARAGRHRRLLRQRRRRDARGRDRRAQPARADRRLRVDRRLQRHRAAARPAQPVHGRHEAAPDAGLHRLRPLRPVARVPRRGRRRSSPTGRSATGRPSSTGSSAPRRRSSRCFSGENIGKMLVRVGPES